MKNRYYICSILFFFLSTSCKLFASHVVGGTLTYVHNGGSSYTITMKLYRDCKPGTAAFDPNITITVLGYNGATFSPSRNVSMSLNSVTSVTSSLDPCAIPPNPVPCVEEGIYTKTVTNLPPNAGGYHLYWQREARNVSILNTNVNPNSCGGGCTISGCSCVGSSFYAYIPGQSVLWGEDFNLANSVTTDNGSTAWSRTLGNPTPGAATVQSKMFQITGASNARATWTSQSISISSCPSVNLNVDLAETGTLTNTDSIFVYYRLNGGPLTLFPTNGFIANDFTTAVASATGLTGTSVQIIVRIHFALTSNSSKVYNFDNVLVSCNNFVANSNPAFDLFPPIFICAGQPFTFDHSATDIDGDQLTYSFYTPYDGDNSQPGAKDPTFPGSNVISFSPIVWQPGYSATNPLGGAPLVLNSSTGLLTGTAGTIGQFVVGVTVKETRNGVLLSQTLRDFQFNVVNCPIPPPPSAGPDISINQGCSAQISAGGYSAASVVWNSIYPGTPGAYNNYLSCTSGCINPVASQLPGAPLYVDYQVCGLSSSCSPSNSCDVVRVYFNPPLSVSINPANPILCPNQTSIMLTATGVGGTPPYSYLWNNLNASPNVTVGIGAYTVQLSDASGCPPVFASVNVTSNAITVNAGSDKTVCKQNPSTTLNGTVTVASGGIWSGGGGTFSPNNTTLSGATYTPTATELANGFVDLTLTTTGNGSCTAVTDVVRINYVNFSGTVSISTTPVTCFGGSDGTATVNITGGISAYTYLWNTVPAQTTTTINGLPIGTYTVIITNSIGCTTTNTATITQPTPIALNTAITDVSCSDGNNGSISVTASGGTGPYTYLWQPGNQTTSSIANKTAGTYTVTVKDSKLCVITSTYTINQPSPITISITPTNVSCYGYSNGIANANVTGGTPPYIYTWSSGATSPNASGLSAGTYTLTVKDNKNCTASNTVTISQPLPFTVSISNTAETCNTQNNGTAIATPTGGTPAYTYLWQPGAMTSNSIANLASTTYSLTVTDALGCIIVSNTVINEPPPLSVNFISQSNVSCKGGNDGSVTANAIGGNSGYTYLWSPGGATTAKITNIQAGTYSVTVTDNKGCTVTNSVTITEPPLLTATATSTNETCDYLNNGTVSVTASGGTTGYTYLWMPDLQTTATVNGLKATTYTVTVTDANGCTNSATTTVSQPSPITLNFSNVVDVTCYGGNNGTATANPNGGTPGYSYLWIPGNTTNASRNNLLAGTYSVTVTDSKGCTTSNSVSINQPIAISTNVSLSNATCNNSSTGSATTIPKGGTPGYTYLWQPGSLTTSTINNLNIGSYTLNVTDSQGCTMSTNISITEPAPLSINFTSQINVSCFGGNDGSVSATPTGGTPNYSYVWMPGGATTSSIKNLTAGTYSVTVTDINGCNNTNTITINQPSQLNATATSTDETCDYLNNGTASVTVTGGTAGYTYLWQPDLQTTATVNGLKATTYTVTVTDTKGCVTTANTTINQPSPIILSFTSTNVNCFDGNDGIATVNATGGTPGYTYLWAIGASTTATKNNLTAGTYAVTVTDSKGCTGTNQVTITQPIALAVSTTKTNETCNTLNNGSATAVPNGGTAGYTYLWQPGASTNATISNLATGSYSLTITDTNGCTANAIANITEPQPLTINFTSQINVSCFGGNDGSVSATPTGGTPNYSYLWMPGGASTSDIKNLSAGTYSVTVTDINGCNNTNTVTINQPSQLNAIATSTDETCDYLNNGTASVTVTGGTAGYTYLWQPDLQTTATVNGLKATTYTVTVTDVKGCIVTANTTVNQPSSIILSFTSTNVDCFEGSDGVATVNATGGTPGYTYLWAIGANTTATKNNLTAGTYAVTVTDSKGCTATNQVAITQPITLIVSTTKTNETCNTLNNGSATAVPNGGTAGYTYLWQPGASTNATISNLVAGSYSLTITDNNGCTANATANITEPAPLSINFTSQINVSCFGGNDGSVSATPTGGTPNYSYVWMLGGATTSSIKNLSAGTYSVTVTDINGCNNTNTITITQPTTAISVNTSSLPASCNGLNNGSVTAMATGGTSGYTYSWMPDNLTGSTINNLAANTYTVIARDALGCSDTNSITVTEPPPMVLTTTGTNSDCGQANGKTSVAVTGGFGPYTYSWSPTGGTNDTAVGLLSGAYTVLVTDAMGCTASQFGNINENTAPSAIIFSIINVSCYGGSDGSASVMASGGLTPYTYSWSPTGGTDSVASGLTAGTYTVVVTGSNGCQSVTTTSPDIMQPSQINISINNTSVNCFGGNDGTAIAVASGGVGNYTYEWLPGNVSSASINGLLATTYTVQVTDDNNCIKNEPVLINQSTQLTTNLSFTPTSCFSGSDGSATASASGGTAPYSYSWMPGNISGPTIGQITAGTYTVTVIDAKGCSIIDSVTVTQPTEITTTLSSINATCSNPNGQASVIAGGGTPNYTYQWMPAGGTASTANSLLAGLYTINVTDNNGCTATDTITVSNSASPTATVSSVTNLTCYGSNNGTATVTVNGGVLPYSYLWLPGGNTNTIATGLATGTYTVTVTDGNNCASNPAISPNVTQPNPIFINSTTSNVSCFGGNNGTITSTITGGTAGYTYLWTPGANTNTAITNLIAGTYTLQVTDFNNCMEVKNFTVTQPSPALSVSLSANPTGCFNGSDGSVTASASGGTAPYSYSWMPGNISGPTIAQITAGTYTVTIIDDKGCSIIDSVTVTQPTEITTTLSSINATCSNPNGQASVIAGGGIPNYTYQWMPAGGTASTANSLLAGLYTINVTDNNGCTATDTITVSNSASPTATVSSVTNLTCYGSNNGTATVTVNGGIPPYSYLWLPGGNTNTIATGLATGTYTVTVTDGNNCASNPAISPNVTQPNPIFINSTTSNVSCFGGNNGTITSTITGGTAGYTYLWTPSANTTSSITNLTAGTYTLQVTDFNNCMEVKNFTVTQPSPALSVSLSANPTGCFNGSDGSATASASGGTAPYSYSWMPGNISGPTIAQITAGTYTVTIIDDKGCSIIDSVTVTQPTEITTTLSSINATCSNPNGQASVIAGGGTPNYTYQWMPAGGTASTANSLLAGLYTINVTDNNGCTANDTITVSNSASPTATVSSVTNLTCYSSNNGTATVTVNGGIPPYSYLWLPGGNTNAIATGLATGTYTVTVTDGNNCSSIPAVSPEITQPTPIFIDTLVTHITCFGSNNGIIVANASGGTPSYNYLWMPGGSTNTTINNLSPTTYTLQVTDGNSCIQNISVGITEPTALTSSISSITDVDCFSDNTGSANVLVIGGTPTYDYNWAPLGGNGSNGSGLTAGTYTVSVTDKNGCSTSSTCVINQPVQALSATSSEVPVSCFGLTDGGISITPAGGTPTYSYLWNPAVSTTNTANNLTPGNYIITLADNNGCETTITASVTEPSAISGTLLKVNPSCSQANGSIASQVSGGTSPYSYLWQQTGATTALINGLTTGTYNLTVTDSTNCSLSLSTTLTITPNPIATTTNLKNVSCFGGNDGAISVAISQGTPPYNISWLPYGGFDTTATLLDTGIYIVSVIDALGCQVSDTAIINQPASVDVTSTSITNVLCNSGNTGSISVSISGGLAPYTYLWSPSGNTSAIASNLTAGTYSVTISDQNNCLKSISAVVNEPQALSASIDSISYPICPTTTGSASVLATGGQPPYSYAWSSPAENEINSTSYSLFAGSYTITVTDSNGCIANTTLLLTAPTPVTTIPGVIDTLCLGQSTTISATAIGGAGGYTYAWQPSAAVTGGNLTISPTSNTTYTVVAYDQNGCPGNSDTINITVYNLTTTNIEAFGASPICQGQSTFIYATANGITGPLTYQWNNNLGSGAGGFLVTPTQPSTYIVTATNTCGSSISDSVEILFNPPPIIDLSLLPTTICSPSIILFDDNSISGNSNDPIISWLWDFGDGNQSSDEDPIYSYPSSGNYLLTLTVTTGGGCTSTNSTSPLLITANPSPLAAFSMNSTYLNLPNESLILTNQTTGANSYIWNFGDGSTSTLHSPTYSYTEIGIFNVQLIAMNQYGCADTATAEITTNADVIFPTAFTPNADGASGGTYDINDFSNNTFFPYTSGVIEYDLQIFNRWGELIFESFDVKKGWDGYYRGQMCQQDVYVWKAYVRLSNGKIYEKVGNVTLIE